MDMQLAPIYFNSQPHKEADRHVWDYLPMVSISTHSLTRRLTKINMIEKINNHLFQLTASQGGWPNKFWYVNTFLHFNSQPHKEADLNLHHAAIEHFYFNSQPHKEADVYLFSWDVIANNFNSQPHKEADNQWYYY